MKVLKNCKGLTLLELILSIAILGIVLVVFLSLFTSGVTTIFFMGQKSQSNIEAQAIIDRIYEKAVATELAPLATEINGILEEMVGSGNFENYTSNISNFNEPYNGKRVRYYLEKKQLLSGTESPVLTLGVFYQNGKSLATITAPLVR